MFMSSSRGPSQKIAAKRMQKKFLMNMIAASMTNKTEWEVCDEVDGLIDRIK